MLGFSVINFTADFKIKALQPHRKDDYLKQNTAIITLESIGHDPRGFLTSRLSLYPSAGHRIVEYSFPLKVRTTGAEVPSSLSFPPQTMVSLSHRHSQRKKSVLLYLWATFLPWGWLTVGTCIVFRKALLFPAMQSIIWTLAPRSPYIIVDSTVPKVWFIQP